MLFTVESINDAVIITPTVSVINADNAPQAREELHQALAKADHAILDMTPVDMLDSSGLGVLVSGLKAQKAKEGSLKLCGLHKNVRALLELVRMHLIFEIYQDRKEAQGALGS